MILKKNKVFKNGKFLQVAKKYEKLLLEEETKQSLKFKE